MNPDSIKVSIEPGLGKRVKRYAPKRSRCTPSTAARQSSSGEIPAPGCEQSATAPRRSMREIVRVWVDMSDEEREAFGGLKVFAGKEGVSRKTLHNYVNALGVPTESGRILLGISVPPAYNKITAADVQDWWNMTDAQREEVRGLTGFAKSRNLNQYVLRQYCSLDGPPKLPGRNLLGLAPSATERPPNKEDMRVWLAMSDEQRAKTTIEDFARERGIYPEVWKRHIASRSKKPTQTGRKLIDDALTVRRPGTSILLKVQKWVRGEYPGMKLIDFAKKDNKVSYQALLKYVTGNRQLTVRGRKWILANGEFTAAGVSGLKHPPLRTYRSTEPADLRAWTTLQPEELRRTNRHQFARHRGLNPNVFRRFAMEDGGLTPAGKIKLSGENPRGDVLAKTASAVHEWLSVSGGRSLDKVAELHEITVKTLKKYVDENRGLTVRGQMVFEPDGRLKESLESLASRHYIATTPEDILDWLEMTPAQREALGIAGFSALHGLDLDEWSMHVTDTGLVKGPGLQLLARSDLSEVIPVKIEPGAAIGRARSTINNNGPILASTADPTRSVLKEIVKDLDNPTVSQWGATLANQWARENLAGSRLKLLKERLKQEFSAWLKQEGQLDEKFRALMMTEVPLHDGVPRGMSVFAKQDLPPYTVLGPYSGELVLQGEAGLHKAFKRRGRHNALTFLFATHSGERSIDGSLHGNILSQVNTGKLPGGDPLPGLDPLSPNNTAVVLVEGNLNFYVTIKPIRAHEEILVDYGVTYDPWQEVEAPWKDADAPFKAEPGIEDAGWPEPSLGFDALLDDRTAMYRAIEEIRTPGQWASDNGDLVPVLAGRSGLIDNRGVIVLEPHDVNAAGVVNPTIGPERVFSPPQAAGEPILIAFDGVGHYRATLRRADGTLALIEVPRDGDCFYVALYATAHRLSPQQVTAAHVESLRDQLADYLSSNPEEYSAVLDRSVRRIAN